MRDWDRSRQEWEREIRESQQNVTPLEALRAAQIVAKRSSDAPISNLTHLLMFLLGACLLGVGLAAFNFRISHRGVLAMAALSAGSFLALRAFRRDSKHRK